MTTAPKWSARATGTEKTRQAAGTSGKRWQKTCWAIDEDLKKPGKVKIIDQDHAAELLEMANDFLA